MVLKGGSMKVSEIQTFLEESYQDPPKENILGYTLDEEISKKSILMSQMTARVYVKEDEKKVIVTHRGTGMEKFGSDWVNNAVYASSPAGIVTYKLTPRYQRAKAVQEAVHKKYKEKKGWEVNTIGHSQGGLLSHLLGTQSTNSIGFNPASKSENLGKNQYIIRSSKDVVSAMSVPAKMMNETLYPGWSKKHYVTITAETNDPITEHGVPILGRLDPEMKIGKGLRGYSIAGINKKTLKGYVINV